MHQAQMTMMSTLFALLAACSGAETGANPNPGDDDPNNPAVCEPNELLGCSDAQTALRCNADGTGDVTEACAAGCDEAGGCNVCTPSSARCTADGLLESCSADGQLVTTQACALGCSEEGGTAHCKAIVPKWLANECTASPAVGARTVSGTFDTSAGPCDRVLPQVLPSGVVGPEVCVVSARSLEIANLKVTGTRAIAFIGDDVKITGLLDISADGSRNGPGVVVTNGQVDSGFGGGGAGFRQVGGSGGGTEFGAHARLGGPVRDPLIEDFFSGGTRPTDDGMPGPNDPVVGGAGGGALVVACRGTLAMQGQIDAGGGGGGSGSDSHGGAGGGSGGYVVLQGAKVAVTGSLFANGGGGGGACEDISPCPRGSDAVGPAGGNGAGGLGLRMGGRGGLGDNPPTAGGNAAGLSTGAGGGSVGRVQVYTPAGTPPVLQPQAPFTFEPNLTVSVR